MKGPDLTQLRAMAATLAVGALGAGIFLLIGFPVAPLTGAALATSAAGLAGLRLHIPAWLRNVTFLTLGINIGSSVTPELLAVAANWPASFLVLTVTLVVALYTSRTMLERGFGYNRGTAMLCSTPGHLSYVLAMAADAKRDVVTISIVQSTRVLCLTVLVPPVIAFVFGESGIAVLPSTYLNPWHGAVLYVLSAIAAMGLTRLRVPAAFLLGAMAVSATGHLSELAPGRLPEEMTTVALVVMGCVIGTRFRRTGARQLRAAMLAGLAVTVVMLGFAFVGAVVVMLVLGLPLGMMLVAFAPGGVEAMAAIALQLGLDPPFVAGHHIFRLILLTFLVPLMMRGQKKP